MEAMNLLLTDENNKILTKNISKSSIAVIDYTPIKTGSVVMKITPTVIKKGYDQENNVYATIIGFKYK